jgi:hypothetical protein
MNIISKPSSRKHVFSKITVAVAAAKVFLATVAITHGQDIFVASGVVSTLGEYTIAGATVNASLIPTASVGIAVSGSDLFVLNQGLGTISEYTTSGALVNASLITGLGFPNALAISGSDIFVANQTTKSIGEYTTSGATVNASLITGLQGAPYGIAVTGSDIFVVGIATLFTGYLGNVFKPHGT